MSDLSFIEYSEQSAGDSGLACLRMIAKYYKVEGREHLVQELPRLRAPNISSRAAILQLSDVAESMGFDAFVAKLSARQLNREIQVPCIAILENNHFVVIYRIRRSKILVTDPARGLVAYSKKEFLSNCATSVSPARPLASLLLVYPNERLIHQVKSGHKGFGLMLPYLKKYKRFIVQLLLGMLLGVVFQLAIPFTTQALVDFGIHKRNLDFIYYLLLGQLMLFISGQSVELIRRWILLHVGVRINIEILSGFLARMMRLSMTFLDKIMLGDILQRIQDQRRIESFLTFVSLNIVYSLVTLLTLGTVLAIYSAKLFAVFFLGSITYIIWITVFMKKRRELDERRFSQLSHNQSHLIELIRGMQDIKLANCEKKKRWEWYQNQAKVFRLNMDDLSLNQKQQAGATFFNELTRILTTFLAAKLVVDGSITLGMMLAVQYVIGQLNGPVSQLLGFIRTAQEARISLTRLKDFYHIAQEENTCLGQSATLQRRADISVKELCYSYDGKSRTTVFSGLNLEILGGRFNAIVGLSGSGKTTLLMLLAKLYSPASGTVRVGSVDLDSISHRRWRQKCGVVAHGSFIFSDTVANNIALGDANVDFETVTRAAKIANATEFIQSLSNGYDTMIGIRGCRLSEGQKQRILIARAVYRDPDYFFFDEAFSALDASNEWEIIRNFKAYSERKTLVIVTHRLSTIKDADQIIVLDRGRAVEQGRHVELIKSGGSYSNLHRMQVGFIGEDTTFAGQ